MKALRWRIAAAVAAAAVIAVGAVVALRPRPTLRLDALGDPLPEGAICRIGALRFTPFGRHAGFDAAGNVLTGASDGVVRVFDSGSGREIHRFAAHEDRSRDPNGPNLLERLLDRRPSQPKDDLPDGVRGLAISPDRTLVATHGAHVVRVFEIATGRKRAEWPLWHASGVVWGQDGRSLVVLAGPALWCLRPDRDDPPTGLWAGAKGAKTWGWSLGLHVAPVVRVTHGDGATTTLETVNLATGARSVRAWNDAESLPVLDATGLRGARVLPDAPVVVLEDAEGVEIARFPAPGAPSHVLGWAPDGARLVVAVGDEVHVLTVDGRSVASLRLPQAYALTFSGDGRRALLLGAGGIHVYDTSTWTETGPQRPQVRTTDFAFLRGAETLAVEEDASVTHHDPRTGRRTPTEHVLATPFRRASFDPWGRRLFTCGVTSSAVTDLTTGARLAQVPWAASGMIVRDDGTLLLRDDATGVSAVSLDGGTPVPLAATGPFAQDESGECVLVCDSTGATLVDARTGARAAWPGPRVHVATPCLSADASVAAVVDIRAARLHVVRVADGATLLASDIAPAARGAAALSPDGKRAAFAVGDGTSLAVHDLVTGDRVALFGDHVAPIRCVRFSGDARLVATGSADTTILVWDLAAAERGR